MIDVDDIERSEDIGKKVYIDGNSHCSYAHERLW